MTFFKCFKLTDYFSDALWNDQRITLFMCGTLRLYIHFFSRHGPSTKSSLQLNLLSLILTIFKLTRVKSNDTAPIRYVCDKMLLNENESY